MAQRFKPNAKLEAYHANIMDRQFNIDWFQGYNIVFNALDNLAARRHVNHMCLAANVPLIESGTTGFNGQVQVIKKVGGGIYKLSWSLPIRSRPLLTSEGGNRMLRLQRERDAESPPYLHNPQQSESTNPLYCLGEELVNAVRACTPVFFFCCLG